MALRGDVEATVVTDGPAPQDGHYAYLGHVDDGTDCPVRPVVRWSVYLAMGDIAPGLLTCGHDVRWGLDPSLMARKKDVKTVDTGKKVKLSGHYSYLEHVVDGTGCLVHPAARRGMYLEEDSRAPGLLTCGHDVRWRLDTPPGPVHDPVLPPGRGGPSGIRTLYLLP